MANNVTTIIGTVQSETEREDFLYSMECFDACEEAKQNEKMVTAGIKTMEPCEVWAKYNRLMFGQ